jgi:tripartite-type tricarboxylate transporter receptor subunit TctC
MGTSSHIQGSLLNLQAGVDLTHVPYKGAAPLLQDLRGGQLSSAFIDMATARPHLEYMKALAVTGAKRNKALPNVPTFAELGFPFVRAGRLVRPVHAHRRAGAHRRQVHGRGDAHPAPARRGGAHRATGHDARAS